MDYDSCPRSSVRNRLRSNGISCMSTHPGNVSAHMVQEVGDVDAAMGGAPRRLKLDLSIERSARTPMEGKACMPSGDSDAEHLTIWSSTQTSTGVPRAAVAARLGFLPPGQVDRIAPDVGGGSASRSCTLA